MSILAYCADHENGGIIADALTWDADDCLMLTATLKADVLEAVDSGLCEWRGDALVCHLYDHDGHAALMTKRAQGKHGAKGGRPRNPVGIDSENPMGYKTGTHAETHGKKTDNPQKSPVQSSRDQEERAHAHGDAPLAPTSGSGQKPPLPMKDRDTMQREFITGLGGELELHGKDLLPEWQKRFKGHTPEQIAWVFKDAKPAIRLPSNFRDAIRERRGSA